MKTLMKNAVWLTATTTMLLAGTANADHIKGHNNCDSTFPMPIPGQEHFDGGVMFVTFIGPLEDDVITNTTFNITYVSDGVTPASELYIDLSVMVDDGFADFGIHGSDLGFGSGPGTFTGTYQTDAFNGVVWPSFLVAPNSTVAAEIGAIQGSGYFIDSTVTFDVNPAPPCPEACSSDLSGDGIVNAADLADLLGAWGPNPGHPADLDGNGQVDAADLATLLGNWGDCK